MLSQATPLNVETVYLLYHVSCVNAPGEKLDAVSPLLLNPEPAPVVLDCHLYVMAPSPVPSLLLVIVAGVVL